MIVQRDLQLAALAMCYGLDSFDIEEACARHGVDPYSSDWTQVVDTVRREYPYPPPAAWQPWQHGNDWPHDEL